MRILFLFIISIILWLGCSSEPFEIEVSYPADESVVNGIIRIIAEVTEYTIVTRVEFFIDDSLECIVLQEPFIYIWNTFPLTDSSSHKIYVKAYDRDVQECFSDTVSVTVINGPVIFADDFEVYLHGEYPSYGGWYELWPGADSNFTCVDSGLAFEGMKSFKLSGSASLVRTDGVDLDLVGVNQLIYECAILVPENSSTGALVGFFVLVNPNLGEIFNGVLFDFQDGMIHVKGTTSTNTGYTWTRDTWYSMKVVLDYNNFLMDVWLDSEQIADDIQAAPRDTSNTFAIATEYGGGGVVYFDDIEIFEDE